MSVSSKKSIPSDLGHFIGGGDCFRHWMAPGFLYTEGIQYLAQCAGSFWLIDVVASHQRKVRRLPFQLWSIRKLSDDAKNAAVVECRVDSGKRAVVRQLIPHTDFPFPEDGVFEWYACENAQGGHTMMLKSEY